MVAHAGAGGPPGRAEEFTDRRRCRSVDRSHDKAVRPDFRREATGSAGCGCPRGTTGAQDGPERGGNHSRRCQPGRARRMMRCLRQFEARQIDRFDTDHIDAQLVLRSAAEELAVFDDLADIGAAIATGVRTGMFFPTSGDRDLDAVPRQLAMQ